MTEIVAVDIGGTHARFALAQIGAAGGVRLGEPIILKTADHPGLESAWSAFAAMLGRSLPDAAGIAVAGPVEGEKVKLTNSDWVLHPFELPGDLGIERFTLINDFGAVGHAVAQLDESHFQHLGGPDRPIAHEEVVSIVGPGTGLGVSQLIRTEDDYHVVSTEGSHTHFAPLDDLEDRILAHLRARLGRVSVERLASGQGLANIYEALCAIQGDGMVHKDEKALWAAAMAGEDKIAAAALDRFCLTLGAAAGDIALVQGATAVVIAGGLGLRLAGHLPRSGFYDRFVAKGRYRGKMEAMPIQLITYEEPGLFGAAAAFAAKFGGRG